MRFNLSNHALEEIERRRIPFTLLESVLETPQQVISEKNEKKAYQSQFNFGDNKTFLLRAIVIDNIDPPVVVTVYRTSKIKKYWR